MNDHHDLEIRSEGALGIISLNRSSHLNALTLDMIRGIQAQLDQWREDSQVQAVLIKSNAAKAFCAGGDIRYLYDSYQVETRNTKIFLLLNILCSVQYVIIQSLSSS